MIYLLNFIWQLILFITLDILSYIFRLKPSLRGHCHGNYYVNNYGIIRSDYNGSTKNKSWYKGKYKALFKL